MQISGFNSRLNTLLAAAVFLLSFSLIAGCSSSDEEKVAEVLNATVDVSGTVADLNDVPLSDVTVSARLVGADTEAEDEATTGANGAYTVTVIENASMYIEVSKTNYATINTRISQVATDVIGLDIGMPTTDQANFIINNAFTVGAGFNVASKAWLAVDVVDANDNEVHGATVTVSSSPAGSVTTLCDGTPSGSTNVTSAMPACTFRNGVMYLAYYEANADVTITVSGVSQSAPVRMGEVTYVLIELP